jgi:hypothetical protein
MVIPHGQAPVVGRDAIRAFYGSTIDAIHPAPRVHTVFEDDPFYVALVDVPNEMLRQRALDLFQLSGTEIVKLEIFSRGALEGVDSFLA